ncbi:hypothetical protein [Kordiimonas laminariae]|uniref:hypothetical protein n=1 Tax=Kordiimonas laminariae TaxID=2917717 RepID=UPI001FF4902B|nr:hypothetical protein [Kordiimonas laminariae]MCK0070069.1 hypothetical protein [Kordiimonas laminariae]
MTEKEKLQTAYDPSRLRELKSILLFIGKYIAIVIVITVCFYLVFDEFPEIQSFAIGILVALVLSRGDKKTGKMGFTEKLGDVFEFSGNQLSHGHNTPFDQVLVELDDGGFAKREIGVKNGQVIHRFPDREGKSYSLFVDIPVIPSQALSRDKTELRDEFLRLWNLR